MDELWTDIKGFEGLYKVSNYGRVLKLVPVRKYLNQHLCGRNVLYLRVALRKNNKTFHFSVHRLVLINFKRPPAPGEECNHIDRDPLNNKINNLEWCSHSENMRHSSANLKKAKAGERHPAAKVTDKIAIEIKRLRKKKIKHKVIAETYGISIQDSLNIATRYYSHLDHLV